MTALPFPLMIFAAGFGTRMGELTRHRPKPLIEVAGAALIDRALDLARAAETSRIVVNAHYKADMLAQHLAQANVAISHETPAILDTGGGLKAALPLLGAGPVMTMNPDVIWRGPNPLALAAAQWDPAKMDALLVCVPATATRGRKGGGDFSCTPDGRLQRRGSLVYGGIQIIKPEPVMAIADAAFSLNAVWDDLAARGRLFAAPHPGPWCDVGHPEGIKIAETLLSEPHV